MIKVRLRSFLRKRLKLNTHSGFSLVELLVATLILLMVSSVVVGGIPVARDAYEKVTVTANAQVLLSTTVNALRAQLGSAQNARVIDYKPESTSDSVNALVYYNTAAHCDSMIYKKTDSGSSGEDLVFYVADYVYVDTTTSGDPSTTTTTVTINGTPRKLVSADETLKVSYDGITINEKKNVVTFTNITVKQGTKEYVSLEKLKIRLVTSSD